DLALALLGPRARPGLLPVAYPARQQIGDALFQQGDAGVPRPDRLGGPTQRLVDAGRVVADEADRQLQRGEVDGHEIPGLRQGQRRHVRRELRQLAASSPYDGHDTGQDGERGDGEYDQHTPHRATTAGPRTGPPPPPPAHRPRIGRMEPLVIGLSDPGDPAWTEVASVDEIEPHARAGR